MIILTVLGWIATVLLGVMSVSMLLLHKWAAVALLILLIILLMPVSSGFIRNKINIRYFPLVKAAAAVLLLFAFSRLIAPGDTGSIYRDAETKGRFETMYYEKMKDWPIPYEHLFLDTEYGKVHVIKSGSDDKPPMVLLHASGIGGWSWKHNAEALSACYQLFAVDTIGDAGLSEYSDFSHLMQTGKDQAELYSEIFRQLGIKKAVITGASEGGFIASNIALYKPETVEQLILAGPMGYSGAGPSIARITFAQMFPLEIVQRRTFKWAFGDNDSVKNDFSEWFTLVLQATAPKKVPPMTLPAEAHERITAPVLFLFGENDRLVGNPQKASAFVSDFPSVMTEIVDAGHLVAAEKPAEVSRLILDFLQKQDITKESK